MSAILAWVGTQALHVALPSLASVAAGFAVKYLSGAAAKVHLDLTQQQQDVLKQQVTDAILAVEEKARKAKDTPTSPAYMSSSDKLHEATAQVLNQHPDANVAQVQQLIHAQLPIVRQQFGSFSTMAR